jgi:hypothetical protein
VIQTTVSIGIPVELDELICHVLVGSMRYTVCVQLLQLKRIRCQPTSEKKYDEEPQRLSCTAEEYQIMLHHGSIMEGVQSPEYKSS